VTRIADALRHAWIGRRLAGLGRSRYKDVWNTLATTEEDAKRFVAGYTDEAELARTAEHTRQMLQTTVGIGSDDVVLEIGAGVGRVGRAVAPLCREWIGADVSENMLRHLRRRLADLPNVRTVALSGYDLAPVPSGSVDVVYCTVVFMHLDEWDRFGYVREGFRVLRPGGRMLVDNFNLASDEGWAFFEATMRDHPPRKRPPHISKASTPQELEAYFRRAGFTDVRQIESGMWIITHGLKRGELA